MATHSSLLAGGSHGQRSLAGCSPWGFAESDTTEQPTPLLLLSSWNFQCDSIFMIIYMYRGLWFSWF